MRTKIRSGLLAIATLTLLSGCASNCNILSSSNSKSCDAMLLGGMILAAPILGPAALFSDAASDAKTKRIATEWSTSMQSRLAKNDLDAIQECLAECDVKWRYELDYKVTQAYQYEAARRFLAGDWGSDNVDDDLAYQLLAHYTLAWQPKNDETGAESTLVPVHVRQSYALLKDESLQRPLQQLLSSSRRNTLRNTVYGMMFAIDAPQSDDLAHEHYQQCPEKIASLVLEDASFFSHTISCERAYVYRFRERLPDPLRKEWQDAAAAKRRAQAS